MTPDEDRHANFCTNVVNTTNFCCVATLWICPLPSVPAWLALAVMAFTTCYQTIRYRQVRRSYDREIKKHLEAGGMVMVVKHGRRWLPVPIPVYLPPRDAP